MTPLSSFQVDLVTFDGVSDDPHRLSMRNWVSSSILNLGQLILRSGGHFLSVRHQLKYFFFSSAGYWWASYQGNFSCFTWSSNAAFWVGGPFNAGLGGTSGGNVAGMPGGVPNLLLWGTPVSSDNGFIAGIQAPFPAVLHGFQALDLWVGGPFNAGLGGTPGAMWQACLVGYLILF